MLRLWPISILTLTAAVGLAACQGCHAPAPVAAETSTTAGPPSLRVYVLSNVAGALEPCGCTKDQLGGVDHLAAMISADKPKAPNRLVVGAGPLLFMDPSVTDERATQQAWNAEAMAKVAREIGLAAWAPGANDWAAGAEELKKLSALSAATPLAANLTGVPSGAATRIVDVGGIKVGIVGVSDPRDRTGSYPAGVTALDKPSLQVMREGIAKVKAEGARVLIGLAAMPRGDALRMADELTDLNVLALGKSVEIGDANDAPTAPALVGTTLVVQASNHLQTVAVVDLYLRDAGSGPVVFADAGGIARADELLSVTERIRALEARINSWKQSKTVNQADLQAREADLTRLRNDKAALEAVAAPKQGNYFLYKSVEVRGELGSDPAASALMTEYYKSVNDHNKTAFADRVPPPVAEGEASYLGVDACTACHAEPRKVWDGTAHSRAYATLQKDHKEYNLDCVSCHVTGYGKPGGSTVTHNATLQNVGCEQCHGPGSLHAKSPSVAGLIAAAPNLASCAGDCHHSPHVEDFKVGEKLHMILGPGHGM